jgi:hypothetical protein
MTDQKKKTFILLSTVPPKGVEGGRVEKVRYRCERLLQHGFEVIVVRPEFRFQRQKIKLKHGTVTYFGRPTGKQNVTEKDEQVYKKNYTETAMSLVKRPIIALSRFITDPQLTYTLTTTNLLLNLISEDTVCLNTQSYPFTNNLVGLLTKLINPDVFWLMEYRDPWVTNPNHSDNHIECISRLLEKVCINNCNKAVYYEGIQIPDGYFESQYPSEYTKIHNIGHWGYDDILINNIEEEKIDKFTIIHAGSFWGDGTELNSLFNAVQNFTSDNNIGSDEFQLLFLGDQPENVPNKLTEYIKSLGWLPYEQAIAHVKAADYGLYINRLHDGDELNISTKMFDYIGCNIPVLCLSKEGWESWEFVRSKDLGINAEVNNTDDIRKKLSHAYYQDRCDIRPDVRSKFSRKSQFKTIISLIPSNDNKDGGN